MATKAQRNPGTVKTTAKPNREAKLEAEGNFRGAIRRLDPNLSEAEVGRRAEQAAGTKDPNQVSTREAEEIINAPKKRIKVPAIKAPMSTTKAQKMIFGIMIAVTALTIIGDILSGKAAASDAIPRRMVAGTIAGIMLMLLAVPVPRIAASLAGVIAIAALFVNPQGSKVIEAIARAAGGEAGTDTNTGQGKNFQRGLKGKGKG